MTKNKNKKNNSSSSSSVEQENTKLPYVSVCTPTFNRRPFIETMIRCFDSQDYPKDKMEWIIIDDGTDPIEDLVAKHDCVKYFKYDEKLTLGKKRNIMHSKSKGDILVYMDDDDFYPPDRVSHAVERLMGNTKALCAGSSEMYIYFNDRQKMVQFGPYGAQHATAGTFAFKRKLLDDSKYNDDACLAEEREFLKNYTVPFVQLDPMKTILVFSHSHNTFDKRILLDNMAGNDCIKYSPKTVEDFIKDKWIINFFTKEMENMLKIYEPGNISMKPDVLKQMKELEKMRIDIKNKMQIQLDQQKKLHNNSNKNGNNDSSSIPLIMFQEEGKPPRELTHTEVVEILSKQQKQLAQMQQLKDLYGSTMRENVRLKEIIEMQQTIIDNKNIEISDLETKVALNNDIVIVN
jgi:glycosyltransferase involved in cell wall biosynthesis